MKTQSEIDKSIEELQPAPEGETLEQIKWRYSHWLLGIIEDEDDEIKVTRDLFARRIAGNEPDKKEWRDNIDQLESARALVRARARALARARARARARALDLALDLDRALDLDLDLDRARALDKLLGDRLKKTGNIDAQILPIIEADPERLDMDSYHCGTAHCRFGWAITMHLMGKELEEHFGPWLAGAVIYYRCQGVVPNAFAEDGDALEDIRRGAA